MGRGDLSDDQWSVPEPLLPTAGVGRPARNQRWLINGVRWRVRTGVPWRDLPAEYGHWQTVYGLFRRWQREGVWARGPCPPLGDKTPHAPIGSSGCREWGMRRLVPTGCSPTLPCTTAPETARSAARTPVAPDVTGPVRATTRRQPTGS
ncbi:transposase [Streptomyces sp. CoH27]|uniref:transposase n=1 Tax=Streptomyces sp. CoH27 TaxID=2875763 RepID=UPI0035A82440